MELAPIRRVLPLVGGRGLVVLGAAGAAANCGAGGGGCAGAVVGDECGVRQRVIVLPRVNAH